ncbi:MAG: tRNA pseudouridine(55) synthase TruB [candidate division Zixibacteria bacterium]|nr:tRNA pseudouridine(55) synthase TruB [candidate division Zixibacteria bacterium]
MSIEGVLLMDKQFGLSSFEALNQVRRTLAVEKAGHTGTLDPGATGLMVVVLGRATKLSAYLSGQEKLYQAVIRLGERRETFDRFGRMISRSEITVSRREVEPALKEFEGEIEQVIPSYSAAHHEGKRLYQYARSGTDIPVKYSKVRINYIELVDYQRPDVEVKIECTSGTYIRSLAEMLGLKLGCGAHLYSLRRLKVGSFSVDDSLTLRQLEALNSLDGIQDYLIALDDALDFPALIVTDQKAEMVKNGVEIRGRDLLETDSEFDAGEIVLLKNSAGKTLALGNVLADSSHIAENSFNDRKVFEYRRVL